MANAGKSAFVNDGSSIIFIVLLISILSIVLSLVFKTTIYVTDFVSEQEHFLRTRTQYKSLQQCILAFIKKNFEHIQTSICYKKKPLELEVVWPPIKKEIKKNAHVTITTINDSTLEFLINYYQSADTEFKTIACLQKITLQNEQSIYKIIQWQPNL